MNVPPGATWTITVHSSTGNFTAGLVAGSHVLNVGTTVRVVAGAVVTVLSADTSLDGGRILLNGNGDGGAGLSTVVVE